MGRLLTFLLSIISFASVAQASCDLGIAGQTATVAIEGTGRTLQLHRPAGDGAPLPLVMLFHGSGGHGATILARSGLAATADANGFIVAAPDAGIKVDGGFAWNIPGVPTAAGRMPAPSDLDDVAYVTAIIDVLAAHQCIDRTRVYATGNSGGGRMTSLLGCVASDRFAAIAPNVGLRAGTPLKSDLSQPDPATCQPSRPMPVISFAGDSDTVNPIAGGGSPHWSYSLERALQRWAQIDGCNIGPITQDGPTWVSTRFDDCRDRVQVVSYVAKGRGHDWLVDGDTMWRFFRRFKR